MGKNYMEKVAQMLGVEMNERFRIKELANHKFYINENGLQCETNAMFVPEYFNDLVAGKYEIRKIPKRKHTGLEDVEAGDRIYRLFDMISPLTALKKQELMSYSFADETIRDNWERYIDIKKRLAKAASELNTEPIDWDNKNQEKWYFFYDSRSGGGFKFGHSYLLNNGSIYFTSKEAAQKAVDMVGTTDLFWAFRYFQAFIGYLKEVTADEQKTF